MAVEKLHIALMGKLEKRPLLSQEKRKQPMLKIDYAERKLVPLTSSPMRESEVAGRDSIHKLIGQSAETVLKEECGEDLFVIGNPLKLLNGAERCATTLAIDTTGQCVLIEVTDAIESAGLIHAAAAASTMSQLDWHSELLPLVSGQRRRELDSFLKKHSISSAMINASQRLILIGESVDGQTIQAAQWFNRQGAQIACYRIGVVRDPATGSDYLAGTQVCPGQMAERRIQKRHSEGVHTMESGPTFEQLLEQCQNPVIHAFFEHLQHDRGAEVSAGCCLIVPGPGSMRFRLTPQQDHALIAQTGRFPGDEEHWEQLSAPHLKVEDRQLEFRIYTPSDVKRVEDFLLESANTVWWLSVSGDGKDTPPTRYNM